MNRIGLVSAAVGVAVLCGCAQQLEQVKQVNQALAVISGAPLASSTTAGGRGVAANPQLTAQQAAAIESSLAAATNDRNIAEARREAAPHISSLLKLMACSPGGYVSPYLGSLLAPGAPSGLFVGPSVSMHYHAKGQCLSVVRLDGWQMKAKNALSFRAVYKSDSSDESGAGIYTFVKQPAGDWLLSTNY